MSREILRRCVGCMQSKDKSTLIRIVKGDDGRLMLDEKMKAKGRGAYICKNMDCLLKAKKRRSLERAIMMKADDALYERLEDFLKET